MKKFGMVLGAAAIAAIAGCKDPNYKRAGAPAGQNDVKNADTTVAQPVAQQTTAPAPKSCTCAPGTVHKKPCTCGGANCFCAVEQKPVQPVVPVHATKPVESVPETSIYVVQSGDYLAKISKKFNVTIAAIKKANNMTNDVVRVGQKLKIPGKVDVGAVAVQTSAAPASAKKSAAVFTPYAGATKEYVVRSGDTLGAIAYGNGITIRQLKELNGLTNDVVRVGQKLKIPAEKQVKAAVPKKAEKSAAKPAEKKKDAVADKPVADKPVADKPADDKPVADKPADDKPADEKSADEKPVADDKPVVEKPATATYVVQEGDDMTGVSIRWGVSAAEIRELNNLGENDQLKPGQIIKLPAEAQQ